MAVHIAVIDPLPIYRQGVAAILSAAGHTVESPVDAVAWVRQRRASIVLLTLLREPAWDLLSRLCLEHPSAGVVGVLEEDLAASGARALRAGARSVLPREATAEMLHRAVDAIADGQVVMPSAVAAALVAGTAAAAVPPVTLEELAWLRQLASGTTVSQLADRVGYSERAMFRLLRTVYRSMGVNSRIEAVMRAQERGWLQSPDGG